ncbi:MAG: hypothetical protein HY721_16780 [Planctomycetes bacterium]|nr:hypothetical protein [Planctomycetota bacterium]
MRTFTRRLCGAALAVCLFAWLLPARALPDRIELKTGEILVGKVLRLTKDEVSIELKGKKGVLSFRRSNVKKVRRSGGDDGEGGEVEGAEDVLPGEPRKKDDGTGVPAGPSGRTVRAGAPGRQAPEPPGTPGVKGGPGSGPGPGAGTGPSSERESGWVKEPRLGIALIPPEGFVPWVEARSTRVPLAWRHPLTQASFAVTTRASDEPVAEVKKCALQACTEQLKTFTVLRNELQKKGGTPVTPEAWLVEMESRLGDVSVRQLQLFTKRDRDVFVLSFSAAGEAFERHKVAFETTIDSFRFLERPAEAR